MACSLARVPPKTRWVWQSIRPGVTQAPPQRNDFLRAETGQLGALADADDLAVGDADRGVGEQAERVAGLRDHRRHMAVGQEAVPHEAWHWAGAVLASSDEQRLAQSFRSVVDRGADAPVGLVGAPLGAGSVTPGGCDLAPGLLRATLRRIGRYDVETGTRACDQIADHGDVPIAGLTIEEATPSIRAPARRASSGMR